MTSLSCLSLFGLRGNGASYVPSPLFYFGGNQWCGGSSMDNCETCKKAQNAPESVPYIAHESAMARMERQAKRLWIAVILLIVLIVGTNGAWIWHESQFSDIETTIESEQDGSGVNIVSGGNLDYGAESKDNNP